MPTLTLPFNFDINVSAQVGDTVYFVSTTSIGGAKGGYSDNFEINSSNVLELGTIKSIDQAGNEIIFSSTTQNYEIMNEGDFVLFSKDNKANMSSLLGYYAKVQIRNNSRKKAEMFKINADYFESSK